MPSLLADKVDTLTLTNPVVSFPVKNRARLPCTVSGQKSAVSSELSCSAVPMLAMKTSQKEYPTVASPSEFQPPFAMSSRMRTFLRRRRKNCASHVTTAASDSTKLITFIPTTPARDSMIKAGPLDL